MSVTNSAIKQEAATVSPPSLEAMELLAHSTYRLPGHTAPALQQQQQQQQPPEVVRNTDGTPLIDHRGRVVTVDRLLATKPLRGELCTRPGPGNRKLTYLSGEGVTRTLNDIFGFDGWNLDIKKTQREECVKDDSGRFHVAYTATVRLTHRKSGAYKEDCGAGDCMDRSMGTAVANALKASITDAMKRAARHFGDKLGNSLYQGNFSINKAPNTLKDALDQYDIERAKSKFGFPKDQTEASKATTAEISESIGVTIDDSTIPASAIKAAGAVPMSTGPLANRAMAPPPVPAFGAAPVHPTNRVVSQTPNGPRSVPAKEATAQLKQAPPLLKQAPSQPQANHQAPSQPQPPPTASQGLQASGMFSGLAPFAAGNKGTAASGNHISNVENVDPIDFDALDAERPGTSTGRKDHQAPLNAKRTLETLDDQLARKMPNLNPYGRKSM